MGNLTFITVLFVVNRNAQARSGLHDRLYLGVGQVAKRQAVSGQVTVLHRIRLGQQIEGIGIHDSDRQFSTGLGSDCILYCLERRKGVSRGGLVPSGCISQSGVVRGLPGAVRIILVGIVHAVCLDRNTHIAAFREQQLHNHSLRNNVRAVNQVTGIVKYTGNHLGSIGVARLLHPQHLLAIFLLDLIALTEERHFSFQFLKADTVTEGCLGVKRRRHQRDRQPTGAFQPGQVKTSLLAGGEQRSTQVGNLIGGDFSPVGRNRSRGKNFSQIHYVSLLTRSRQCCPAG